MPNSEDVTTWRSSTIGGIPYRFLGSGGNFTAEKGVVTWKAIFRVSDFLSVLDELFPPPIIVGNISIPQAGIMPGANNRGLVAKSITYKTQGGIDLPVDPFSQDATAPDGTYHSFLEVSIQFGPSEKPQGDANDPRTFLEIDSNVGGEYIYVPPTGTKLETDTNADHDDTATPGSPTGDSDEVPGAGPVDATTARMSLPVVKGTSRPNKHPQLPLMILVPTTEWSITWRQIPYDIFRNVLVWRFRTIRGRCNLYSLPWLMNSPPETILCTGFTYKESYTWRDGKVNTPPIDLTIKFLEKSPTWKGITCGHNHMFVPGEGWSRVTLQDGTPPHKRLDFNFAFKV